MTSVKGLHVIVGGNDVEQTYEVALIADAEGAAVVQLREKSRPASEVLEMADTLRKIIQHATFIINDRPDIAFATGSDGVHLGQDDLPLEEARKILGPNAIIGVSTSNVQQAIEAERAGANYLGFGHMFPTRSKEKHYQPRSREELHATIAAVSIPVVAIGGITTLNAEEIFCPGIGGIAVISAVSESKNPAAIIRQFVKMLEKHHAITA
jgi:thiamine-phosphate pyrophosphorylase